ncbi:YkgJ family cysteine cluster protein [bacterium]|nr:YkgJ family cysteine cluster protein [bacterium]
MIPELRQFDDGSGICIHLTADNLCDIYSTRPDICNVDKMYEIAYRHLMTRDDYDRLNLAGCQQLQALHQTALTNTAQSCPPGRT